MSKLFIRSIVGKDETIEMVVKYHWTVYFTLFLNTIVFLIIGAFFPIIIPFVILLSFSAYLSLRFTEKNHRRVIKKTYN